MTGETNDVVRSYGFALTEQASVTLLMPRRNHCSPEKGNGAERNRTAVRNTGVDHLVRKAGPCHSDSSGDLEHNALGSNKPAIRRGRCATRAWKQPAGDELSALGAHAVQPGRRAVSFQADMACLYRLHLQARLPFRLLRQVARFPCQGRDDLYDGIRDASTGSAGCIPR